ncbi:DNA breaking-rejoining protein [Cronobacter malonaticus]
MNNIHFINFNLSAINNELALFKCENNVSGVIHTTEAITTVVLDGGYILGRYKCVHDAIDEITDVHLKLDAAEKRNGNYTDYKRNMVGTVFH